MEYFRRCSPGYGASREIDCNAIGGSGRCKMFDMGWAGEKRSRTFGLIQAANEKEEQASLEEDH
jgi:hypothetical protein